MLLKHWQTEGDSVSGVNEGLAKMSGGNKKGRKHLLKQLGKYAGPVFV